MTEGLEALKELMNNVIRNDDNLCDKKVAIIEKELKALEIMTKSLKIGEEDFFYDDKENIYYFIGGEISKEEYNLLKEELL